MALTVEDGSGKSDADSYISLVDADIYVAAHSVDAGWTAATDPNKEKALRRATQYLDLEYGGRWKSDRTNEDQALDWPRTAADDRDEYAFDSNEMPSKLLDACCECAVRFITEDMMPDFADPGIVQSKSVRVGPISESVTYSGGSEPGKGYPIVEMLLRGLLVNTAMVSRG